MKQAVSGFSKLSKEEKIAWIATTYFSTPENAIEVLKNYWNCIGTYWKIIRKLLENYWKTYYFAFIILSIFNT